MQEKHPHVRGEDAFTASTRFCSSETPPRAWGRPTRSHNSYVVLGNTPTCVGKTEIDSIKLTIFEKHPHVRGEDLERVSTGNSSAETPPRAWGRLLVIPCIFRNLQKHPHVRGEDYDSISSVSNLPETPPRAWGRQPCAINN